MIPLRQPVADEVKEVIKRREEGEPNVPDAPRKEWERVWKYGPRFASAEVELGPPAQGEEARGFWGGTSEVSERSRRGCHGLSIIVKIGAGPGATASP